MRTNVLACFPAGKQTITRKEVDSMSFQKVANLGSEEVEKINSLQDDIKKTCGRSVVLVAFEDTGSDHCCR
jgi:hypothetical protein